MSGALWLAGARLCEIWCGLIKLKKAIQALQIH